MTRRGEAAWAAVELLDGMRVVRVPPPGPGRRGSTPWCRRRCERSAGSPSTFSWCGARVCSVCPAFSRRGRSTRPVVLQAEINGELSGQAYTWGTRLEARPRRDLVGAAVRGRNLLLRDADAFVAMSSAIRDEFVGAGVSPERVHRIPHGIDTERFRPAAAGSARSCGDGSAWPPDADVLIYTGRLLRGKGLETLLEPFAGLRPPSREPAWCSWARARGRPWTWRTASEQCRGGGPRRPDRPSPGRVDDVENYLRAADVFVFPSRFEALGISWIEAAACGLPAVGSRTGGIVDVDGGRAAPACSSPPGQAAPGRRRSAPLRIRRRAPAIGEGGREGALARFDGRRTWTRYRALVHELLAWMHHAGSP